MQGDVTQVLSCGSVPRNRQQITNARKRLKESNKERDTLFAIMERCKREQSKSMPFIRSVLAAPEPMCLLCNDRQLHDIERFCCNSDHFSILGIDPTFNLGEFLVTITTYRHLLLKDQTTGKPPVMIGPALVHQTKKTETYHSLASGIVGLCPSLMNLIAYGTDGEKAIGNAFSLQFHKAIHLLCCLHVKRDIQRKLHDLGIPEKYSKEYINEIFGHTNGSHFTEGLVDCECDSEYEDQLNKCCHVWNEREKLARDTNVPVFYDWFKTYHSDLVKTKMLKPVRVQAGLGDPPDQYTTNDNESINSRVKDKVDYKASELHIFCQKFEELVDMQTRNIERAFTLSNGPYCVLPLYSDLLQKPKCWPRLSLSAKEQFVRKIHHEKVRSKHCTLSVQSVATESENTPPLSVRFNETGLPDCVYKAMWEKACMLHHHELISDVPGHPSGKMVASLSCPEKPHLVNVLKCGKLTCDCLNYQSKSLCSHVIATAESIGELRSLLKISKSADIGF